MTRAVHSNIPAKRSPHRGFVTTNTTGEHLRRKGCSQPFYVDPSQRGRVLSVRVDPNEPPPVGAVLISCGRCEACCKTRMNMLTGRAAAEAVTSERALFVTLTYSPNDDGTEPEGATRLMLEHVRKFRQDLKNRIGPHQYLIAGEYGARRGRAHWHALIYFPKGAKLPGWADFPDRVAFDWRLANRTRGDFQSCGIRARAADPSGRGFRAWLDIWPHGHVDIKKPDEGAYSYASKYLLRNDQRLKVDRKAAFSRETAGLRSRSLGLAHVISEGKRHAREGLCPQRPTYCVPALRYKRGRNAGRHIPCTMTRAARREFFNAYLQETAVLLRAGRKLPALSEAVQEHMDRMARNDPRYLAEGLARQFVAKVDARTVFAGPYAVPPAVEVSSTVCGGTVERDASGVWRLVYRHADAVPGSALAEFAWPITADEAERAAVHGGWSVFPGAVAPDMVLSSEDERAASSVLIRADVGPLVPGIPGLGEPALTPAWVFYKRPLQFLPRLLAHNPEGWAKLLRGRVHAMADYLAAAPSGSAPGLADRGPNSVGVPAFPCRADTENEADFPIFSRWARGGEAGRPPRAKRKSRDWRESEDMSDNICERCDGTGFEKLTDTEEIYCTECMRSSDGPDEAPKHWENTERVEYNRFLTAYVPIRDKHKLASAVEAACSFLQSSIKRSLTESERAEVATIVAEHGLPSIVLSDMAAAPASTNSHIRILHAREARARNFWWDYLRNTARPPRPGETRKRKK